MTTITIIEPIRRHFRFKLRVGIIVPNGDITYSCWQLVEHPDHGICWLYVGVVDAKFCFHTSIPDIVMLPYP